MATSGRMPFQFPTNTVNGWKSINFRFEKTQLTKEQRAVVLPALKKAGWKYTEVDETIERTFEFKDFPAVKYKIWVIF